MSKNQQDIQWMQTLSEWLDSKFTIPYTNIKYGLDPIFSLFPIIGDLVTYVVSLLIIATVNRKGASGELIIRMLLNATLDVVIGSIPVIGTIFDVGFKSNKRNLALMKAHYEQGKYQGNGKFILALVCSLILVILLGLLYLTYLLLAEIIQLLNQ